MQFRCLPRWRCRSEQHPSRHRVLFRPRRLPLCASDVISLNVCFRPKADVRPRSQSFLRAGFRADRGRSDSVRFPPIPFFCIHSTWAAHLSAKVFDSSESFAVVGRDLRTDGSVAFLGRLNSIIIVLAGERAQQDHQRLKSAVGQSQSYARACMLTVNQCPLSAKSGHSAEPRH